MLKSKFGEQVWLETKFKLCNSKTTVFEAATNIFIKRYYKGVIVYKTQSLRENN